MATHSSIPAWEIPRTEEPGGLQSVGRTESDMPEATEHAPLANFSLFFVPTSSICILLCFGFFLFVSLFLDSTHK